jgi:hypothetical protein
MRGRIISLTTKPLPMRVQLISSFLFKYLENFSIVSLDNEQWTTITNDSKQTNKGDICGQQ